MCSQIRDQINEKKDALKEATGGFWVCVDMKTIPKTDQTEQHKYNLSTEDPNPKTHTFQIVTIALRWHRFATRVKQTKP